jgi:hypothetical protein
VVRVMLLLAPRHVLAHEGPWHIDNESVCGTCGVLLYDSLCFKGGMSKHNATAALCYVLCVLLFWPHHQWRSVFDAVHHPCYPAHAGQTTTPGNVSQSVILELLNF